MRRRKSWDVDFLSAMAMGWAVRASLLLFVVALALSLITVLLPLLISGLILAVTIWTMIALIRWRRSRY